MSSLYPLKFNNILKEKVWGGTRLKDQLRKDTGGNEKIGESWELSAIQDSLSEVNNGFLEGNNIEELIEIYMGDLVGDAVYDKFGIEFPLLVKFIDANDFLSIQVHPDDKMAKARHNSFGKTEMWYVVSADNDAELVAGFNQKVDKAKYVQNFGGGTLREILNFEKVLSNDVFFMPAGSVHATGPGILFAEIQQTSDVTYRIYDWDRVGIDGKPRELHTELAFDAINYNFEGDYKVPYKSSLNKKAEVVKCDYFTTNILEFDQVIERDYHSLDSFVIYIAVGDGARIMFGENEEPIVINKGETILVPAELKELFLEPLSGKAKLLEVYIEM